MAFLVCLLFRESIGVAITKSFVIFVRKFFVSSIFNEHTVSCNLNEFLCFCSFTCSINPEQ